MMSESTKTEARVNGKRYMDLPEGHRTTFVVGMIDMMSKMKDYMEGEDKEPFSKALDSISDLTSGDVREEFDRYMQSDPTNSRFAVSSCFLSMLFERALEKKSRTQN